MTSCKEFTEKLESLKIPNDPVILSLNNFFLNFRDAEKELDLQDIEAYFRRLYTFSFWRLKQEALEDKVKAIFFRLLERPLAKKLGQSLFLQSPQVLELTNKRDLYSLAEKYASKKNLHYQILEKEKDSLFLHYKWPNGNQALQRLSKYAFLKNAEIHPLILEDAIYFDSHMDLIPFQKQRLLLDDNHLAHIEVQGHGIECRIFKGYSLNTKGSFYISKLENNSQIYYSLKKMESYISGKKDSSMYQNLCEMLEKALDLLKTRDPESVKLAFVALERGKNAFQTTFPEDKLLQVLIRELNFHLEERLKGNSHHDHAIK